jgi:hypothetical protein
MAVPLYRCADCGFVTTASHENALEAHAVGSPHCSGQLTMIADFARWPAVTGPPGRRRRRAGRPLSGLSPKRRANKEVGRLHRGEASA